MNADFFLSAIYVFALCTAVFLVGRSVTRGIEWLIERVLDFFAGVPR